MGSLSGFFAKFDIVLCISLPESNERRLYMSALSKRYGIDNFQFIDALNGDSTSCRDAFENGRVLNFPPCFRCGLLTCGKDDCNNTLIPPQVATFLSYEKAWRWLIDSRYKNALIVEDDLAIADKAELRANDILRYGLMAETPLLNNKKPFLIRFGWALCAEHDLDIPVGFKPTVRMSNPCHAINKKMAEKLLSESGKISTTVDVFQHQTVCDDTNSLSCVPPLFYELSWSTGEVESLIHPKSVRIDYLKMQNGQEVELEKAKSKLDSHRKHTSAYSILGLGHPRCGSGYTAKLMNAIGLNVGHEKLESDGIVSWMFASDAEAPWALNEGARSKAFKHFTHIVHHVRNPRSAIPSILRDDEHSDVSRQFRRQGILDAFSIDINNYDMPLARAVASFIYWNKLVAQQQPNIIYRIEDQESKLIDYLVDNGVVKHEELKSEQLNLPEKNVNTNRAYQGKHYEKPTVRTESFLGLPDSLLKGLNDYCRSYGYPIFDKPQHKVVDSMKPFQQLTLKPMGWNESSERELPVDINGKPLPWWTYPAIEFVESVVSRHDRVFEYGGGHSTLWWSQRVSQVVAVDHDKAWVEKVSKILSAPHKIKFQDKQSVDKLEPNETLNNYLSRNPRCDFDYDTEKIERRGLLDAEFLEYAKSISQPGGKFDWIVIDGMCRRLCAHFAVNYLADNGIIIFDNSNRSDYFEGYQFLVEQGFYQIRFSGIVPGANFPSCSSIFIKSLDALPKITFSPSMFHIPEY